MADESKGLKWYIRAVFDRESGKQVSRELEDVLAESAKKGGTGFIKELRAAFDKRMADLRVSLAKGLIDQNQFKAQANHAAQTFNTVMLAAMEKARLAGTLTEREFVKLSRQLKTVGEDGATAFDRIKGKLLTVGAALGSFFALSRLQEWGRQAVASAVQARHALAQLEATVKSTGGVSGFTTAQLLKQAEALERLSLFSKEAVQGGLTRLLTYTAIQGEMFERASVAALDMAQRLGIDVASAAEKVGNALNYPTKALNSLTRQGFRFTEQQTQQIKEMERTGNIAGAQAIILGELELAYGGAAKAAADTVGPWRQFGLEVGRLKEGLGETILRMAEQSGVAQKLTGVVATLADNVGRLVSVVVSLGKALLVAGVLAGMTRLVTVVRAADLAFKGWRATLVSMQPLMGPRGWFTLGVIALTVAFEKLGAGARKAAAEARAALEDFGMAVQSFTDMQMDASAAVLDAERVALERKIAGLKEAMTGEERLQGGLAGRRRRTAELVHAEQALNLVMEKGNALLEERRRRSQRGRGQDTGGGDESGAGGGGGAAVADPPDTAAIDKARQRQEAEDERLAAKREAAAERERERLAMLAEEQATYDALALADKQEAFRQELALAEATAYAEETRRAVAAGAIQVTREANAALHAYNREQYIANELLRYGAEAGTTFGEAIAQAAGGAYDAAHQFVTPWQDALAKIREEVEGAGTLFGDLARAWAEGGFAGIAAYAKAKFKENIAAAIENAAKALGSFGLGNPIAAAKYQAASIKHAAAAAAWKVAGAAAGGGGAGAAGGGGGSVANSSAGSTVQPPGPEVHIYIDPLSPDDPRAQTFVRGAVDQAQERYGNNAKVRVHRRAA